MNNFKFIVYSCYLPPQDSVWTDTTVVYGHLISQLYTCSNFDAVFISGDLNSRIGNSSDSVLNVVTVSGRRVIDFE